MSSRLFRPLAVAIATIAGVLCLHFGVAGAASFDAMLGSQLQPSEAPALLAPIAESGRTGWACKPERAASARRSTDSELPAVRRKQ